MGARLRDRGGAHGARLGPRRTRDRADRLAHRPGQRPLAAGGREARRARRSSGSTPRRAPSTSGCTRGERAAAPTRGDARGRRHVLARGADLDTAARGARRRRRQDRAARRRPRARLGPPFWSGESAMFLASNAGKRSLALDLGDPRGLEALLRLADRADVLVQSLRPGAAEQRGFGPDAVRARNPRLVYCTIGAFGATGPLSDQPGYDPLMQAAAGIMSVTGEDDRPPVRVGVSLIDLGTGVWAALGVLAALHERERTGVGPHARRVPLRDGAVAPRVPARRLPRHRRGAGPRGERVRTDRAVPGVPDRGRRLDDRRRERQALRRALPRARRSGTRRTTRVS